MHSSVLFNPYFVDVIHNVTPKSCSRSYVHFCVPWILDDLPMIPEQGLQMTSTVAYIDSLAM